MFLLSLLVSLSASLIVQAGEPLPEQYKISCNNHGNRPLRVKEDFSDSSDGLLVEKTHDKYKFRLKDISQYDGEILFEIPVELCASGRVLGPPTKDLAVITCEKQGEPESFLDVEVSYTNSPKYKAEKVNGKWEYTEEARIIQKTALSRINLKVRNLHVLGATPGTSHHDMSTYGFIAAFKRADNQVINVGETRFLRNYNCLSDISRK